VVFSAASLSAPIRLALDTFARRDGAVVQEEHGASLELARRITALGRVPDLVALADLEVFPEMLTPTAMSWYAAFARNRMVVAYTDRSRYANEISGANWPTILQRHDVTVGRSDPAVAPVGYRALLTYALAEQFYHDPGLAQRLERQTPPSHIRGNATELAALLSARELDYIVDYESLAKAQHFRYVTLPPEIDLSDPAHVAEYAMASVRVPHLADTVTRRGGPILYGLSIPRAAQHPKVAERFLEFLFSREGKALMRAQAIDMFDTPVVTGDSAPARLTSPR
jgi:molybdate/tungstate transport system substrate-binding protein